MSDLSNLFRRQDCVRVFTLGAGTDLSDAQAELLPCRKAAPCDPNWVPGKEAPTRLHMPPRLVPVNRPSQSHEVPGPPYTSCVASSGTWAAHAMARAATARTVRTSLNI